ncbi:MAG TPA: hypothetical protein VN203_28180, partial [Candidatus Acidoferrum sp.]|nr:hypothetical protein [Candidatus Acidoferrum sp.]
QDPQPFFMPRCWSGWPGPRQLCCGFGYSRGATVLPNRERLILVGLTAKELHLVMPLGSVIACPPWHGVSLFLETETGVKSGAKVVARHG